MLDEWFERKKRNLLVLKKTVESCQKSVKPRKRRRKPRNPLVTIDTFIAAVPWGEWRRVLVFRREHSGKTYIRLRTWNKHRTKHVWYPTKRFYVVPIEGAESLAGAIKAAAQGEPLEAKPAWYAAREEADQEHYERLLELNAPEEVLEDRRRRIQRRKQQSV